MKLNLPDAVKSHLPVHAQEIYKDAFDKAWIEYSDPSKGILIVPWRKPQQELHGQQ